MLGGAFGVWCLVCALVVCCWEVRLMSCLVGARGVLFGRYFCALVRGLVVGADESLLWWVLLPGVCRT